MNTVKILCVIILLSAARIYSQGVYELEFCSGGNKIDLGVINESGNKIDNVKVEVPSVPGWIKFENGAVELGSIEINEEKSAGFEFAVTKEAEIETEKEILFNIISNGVILNTKLIKVKVGLPKEYTLEQNYPNPFNPATIIGYQLPQDGNVRIKVYDVLGREIATIINEIQKAGFHELTFNGKSISSGMYIYSLEAGGKKIIKKMLLLK